MGAQTENAITLPAELYRVVDTPDGRQIHFCTERQIALHVVGLDYNKPYKRHGRYFYHPYRNYFSGEEAFLEKLVAAGLMECRRDERPDHVMYWYNRAGLDWLGEQIGVYIYDERD